MDTDLSTTNVRFLRVIRNINTNPDEYEHSDKGKMPANTTAIRKASDFSRNQINYRLAPDRGTDFTDSGLGLLKIHPASVDESGGFGPKSVELTQAGLDVLSSYAADDDFDPDDFGSDSEIIEQLHARVRALEDHSQVGDKRMGSKVTENTEGVERVEAKLDELIAEIRAVRDSEWGGVADKNVENLQRILNRAPAMMYAFTILLEIDIDEIVDMGGYSQDEADEIRGNLYAVLESASGVSSSDEGNVGDTVENVESESVRRQNGVESVDESGGVDSRDRDDSREESEDDSSDSESSVFDVEHEPPSFANSE